jgi:hypothetical protein
MKSGDTLHCEHALDVVGRIGKDRLGQAAVRSQIKSIVRAYSLERSIVLRDGVSPFNSDCISSDDVRRILEYLKNNLGHRVGSSTGHARIALDPTDAPAHMFTGS